MHRGWAGKGYEQQRKLDMMKMDVVSLNFVRDTLINNDDMAVGL